MFKKIENIEAEEILERKKYIEKNLIYIPKIFEKLEISEKTIDIYAEKLKKLILKKCKIQIGYAIPLFSIDNYILKKEIEIRKEAISKIKLMKSSFSFFKKEEKKCINNDIYIESEKKEALEKVLDTIIKQLYKKFDYACKKFREELNSYQVMLELNLIPDDKNVSDITNYVSAEFENIIKNDKIPLTRKRNKPKKMDKDIYANVIAKTLSKILPPEKISLEFVENFIKDFNKNVEIENAKNIVSKKNEEI